MFKVKRVLTIVLLALVFSLGAFAASAQEPLDGWVFGEGDDLFFYRGGEPVTGVVNVPLPADWWPGEEAGWAWGSAPATRYFSFDETGLLVRLPNGWNEIGGEWYWVVPGYSISDGWHWWPEGPATGGTMHYLQPAAATGNLVLTTNIPSDWTYDTARVTHRWFDFGDADSRGVLQQTNTGWVDGVFYFGYGVTRGWVYEPRVGTDGRYFFHGQDANGKPILATGGPFVMHSPWTGDERTFTFAPAGAAGAGGRLLTELWRDASLSSHLDFAIESFLPGITFIILSELDAGTFGGGPGQMTFIIRTSDGKYAARGEELYPQAGGGWRIALDGEYEVADISLQIFG